MPVPNTFGTATSAIPLSDLDDNFAAPITIGNTAVQLGNTVTTLNNMTLANVTISSGNVTITNVGITNANVSGTANISTLVVVGNATVGGNITAANANVTTNLVLSNGTANGVAYLNVAKVLTTGSVLVFDGTNLGVGITPTTKLHVSSASNTFGTVESTNGAAYWQMIGNNATNASYNSLISKYGATTDWSISGGNGTTGQMLFNIGSTEGFRLTSTSLYTASTINVGIGTPTPTRRLTVVGDTTNFGVLTRNPSGYGAFNFSSNTITSQVWSFIAQDNGANSDLLLYGGASAGTKLTIDSSGIVTMNAYGAGAATFSAAGVISSVSDETWKIKDGVPVDPDSMLKKLEPGYWYYNEEKAPAFGADRQLGFYAQNVNSAIGPEAAPTPEEGKPWGYYDRSVLAVTVMSLQKALATIETLTARITALEGA